MSRLSGGPSGYVVGVTISVGNDLGAGAGAAMCAEASGPTAQDSRGPAARRRGIGPLAGAFAAAALAGAGLMIAGEFQTVFAVRAGGIDVSSTQAGGHHGYALIVLGLGAIFLGVVGAGTGSRAAAVALLAVGVIGAAVVLAIDLPDATESGVLSGTLAPASASPQLGLWLGLGGSALVAAAGAGLLWAGGRR